MAKKKARIFLRNGSEIDGMREAGALAAQVLRETCALVRPGITTGEVDQGAAEIIEKLGCKSAFLGYRGFPGNICISVNEEIVHGIGGKRELLDHDILKVDVGIVTPSGWVGDNAKSIPVGTMPDDAAALLAATEESLYAAIRNARAGNQLSQVCSAVSEYVEPLGYGVVREFVGHGVGRELHEEPQVPNYWDAAVMRRQGFRDHALEPGMILAIEPMINQGTADIKILEDRWTVITADRSLSAHFEHTVLITDGEAEILTPRERSFPETR